MFIGGNLARDEEGAKRMRIGGLAQLAIVIGAFLILCVLFPVLGQFIKDLWDRAFHFIMILGQSSFV